MEEILEERLGDLGILLVLNLPLGTLAQLDCRLIR